MAQASLEQKLSFPIAKLSKEVNGRVCLVTGGGSGIGYAISERLVAAGAELVLASTNLEKLSRAREQLFSQYPGAKVHIFKVNLSDHHDATELTKRVLEEVGRVDILFNNAGKSIRRPLVHAVDRLHDYKRTMDVNYFGSTALVLGFIDSMRKHGYGRVINISSITVQVGQPRFGAYVASKAAMDALSMCLNAEFADENITFHTVYMPAVTTDMIAPTDELRKNPDAIGYYPYGIINVPMEKAAALTLSALTTGRKVIKAPLMFPRLVEGIRFFSHHRADQFLNYLHRLEIEIPHKTLPSVTDPKRVNSLTGRFLGRAMESGLSRGMPFSGRVPPSVMRPLGVVGAITAAALTMYPAMG